ncbi:PH domain-containing protein [Gallaecimonas kandeliae]|uniref:PH domain-containing protein n=1 Tax=Gallaecimonas kandeliae TaxID=3029055 RepID=UPI00264927B8|nr:PH domain-containing protein [Gallaecimonas kandeliae]WKE66650.1 PH domain-containing protein [Gallaecimonas kandeliae]
MQSCTAPEYSLGPLLAEGEQVDKAYRLVRDLFVFTNKRLLLVDKQGLTGKKPFILSVPYSKVTKYALETAGHFDLDAEIKVWVGSEAEPISRELGRGNDVRELYRTLSSHLL